MGLYYALPGHFDDLIEPGTHVDWTDDQSDIGDFGKVEGRHRTTSDVIRMRAAANCSGAAGQSSDVRHRGAPIEAEPAESDFSQEHEK